MIHLLHNPQNLYKKININLKKLTTISIHFSKQFLLRTILKKLEK